MLAKPLATKSTTTHNETFVVRACKSVMGPYLLWVDKPIYWGDGLMATCERGDFSASVADENLRLCGGGGCLIVSVGGTSGPPMNSLTSPGASP